MFVLTFVLFIEFDWLERRGQVFESGVVDDNIIILDLVRSSVFLCMPWNESVGLISVRNMSYINLKDFWKISISDINIKICNK